MDRNTLTGLVLIGLLLTVFTIINKPSEEELKQQEAEIAKAKEAKAKSQQKDASILDKTKSSMDSIVQDESENTTEEKTETGHRSGRRQETPHRQETIST